MDPTNIDITATAVDNQMNAKQQRLAELAQDTRFRMKRSTEDLIQIGINLLEAKKLCSHGEWLPWIEKEFTAEYALTDRTAQHYMNVAQKFGDKSETVSDLPIAATAFYMLAATSVPDEAREEAIKRAAAGETITKKTANRIIQQYTSVDEETKAKADSLGRFGKRKSALPESDRTDELTHTSPTDVDDRPGASPIPTRLYKHGIVAGDTVRILLGKGKHSDKLTTATSVTAKEIVTPLGTFKPSALVKYIDRTAEMGALGIVPGAIVATFDGTKGEVICTFADGRVLASGNYFRYSELTVLEPKSAEADESAIAASVESTLPEILADDYEPDFEKSAPADLSEVGSASDMDALIDFQGTTVVARMFVAASPELQRIIKNYYPGIAAIVTSELGGSELNKIAKNAGFLPNQEPDAVRVEMLIQENARLDEALRLCEERAQRLERQNSELLATLEEAQAEIEQLTAKNVQRRCPDY